MASTGPLFRAPGFLAAYDGLDGEYLEPFCKAEGEIGFPPPPPPPPPQPLPPSPP
eukprot:COSAG04_NODE_11817_length_686_cov_47.449744_1_plen_54_part_10